MLWRHCKCLNRGDRESSALMLLESHVHMIQFSRQGISNACISPLHAKEQFQSQSEACRMLRKSWVLWDPSKYSLYLDLERKLVNTAENIIQWLVYCKRKALHAVYNPGPPPGAFPALKKVKVCVLPWWRCSRDVPLLTSNKGADTLQSGLGITIPWLQETELSWSFTWMGKAQHECD